MKKSKMIMGMVINVEIICTPTEAQTHEEIFKKVFGYFEHIDETFSTYKTTSEVSKINAGNYGEENYSAEMNL